MKYEFGQVDVLLVEGVAELSEDVTLFTGVTKTVAVRLCVRLR